MNKNYEKITTEQESETLELLYAISEQGKVIDFAKYKPTLNKAFAKVKMLGWYPIINRNKDSFDYNDFKVIKDNQILQTLIGSFFRIGHEPQTKVVGNYQEVEVTSDGLFAVVMLEKSLIKEYGYTPQSFKASFNTSIEAFIDPVKSEYFIMAGNIPDKDKDTRLTFNDVKIQAEDGSWHIDKSKYDYRIVKVIEFTGGAAIPNGKQADLSANIEAIAASQNIDSIKEGFNDDEEILDYVEDLYSQKVFTYKERQDLPDSSFALIKTMPNGTKKRSLPYKDKNGNIMDSLVRNALARLNQVQGFSAEEKLKAKKKLQSAMKKVNPEYESTQSKLVNNNGKENNMNGMDNPEMEQEKSLMKVGKKKKAKELMDRMMPLMQELQTMVDDWEEDGGDVKSSGNPKATLKQEYEKGKQDGFTEALVQQTKFESRITEIQAIDVKAKIEKEKIIAMDENAFKMFKQELEIVILKAQLQENNKLPEKIIAGVNPPPAMNGGEEPKKINLFDCV